MATDKPRITVTLEPHTYNTIKRLAEIRKVSISSILSDMADESVPSLQRVISIFEAAEMMDKESLSSLKAALAQTEEKIMTAYQSNVDQLEQLNKKVKRKKARASK